MDIVLNLLGAKIASREGLKKPYTRKLGAGQAQAKVFFLICRSHSARGISVAMRVNPHEPKGGCKATLRHRH